MRRPHQNRPPHDQREPIAVRCAVAALGALALTGPMSATTAWAQPEPGPVATSPASATGTTGTNSPDPQPTPLNGTSPTVSGAPATPGSSSSSIAVPVFNARNPPVGGQRLTGQRLIVDLPAGIPAPPKFKAGAFVIADLDSGQVIAAQAPHVGYLPASTMKTLTALTLIDRLDPKTPVVAAREDADVDGTKVGMVPGASYPVESLFEALMLSSANDAAVALARANGGLATTCEQMNALAQRLGALDTHAENTSGLDAPGQLTSAYDLALIGRAALRNPNLAPLLTQKSAQFPGGITPTGAAHKPMEIANHNRLLWNYSGTTGVKNGYTNAAGATYIGTVRRGERAYVFAYLKADTGHWQPSADMFNWAFAYGDLVRPVGRLVEPDELASGESDSAPEDGAAAGSDRGTGDWWSAAQNVASTISESSQALPAPLRDPKVLIGGGAAIVIGALFLRFARRR